MSNKTVIKGKDRDLESTIETMRSTLNTLGFQIEEASWHHPVPNVYSVHIRDAECALLFTNGKGACEKSCLASALGEYFERMSCNYFFADYYLGSELRDDDFMHYPNERWFEVADEMPQGLLDENLWEFYDPEGQLQGEDLFDANSGAFERGICALPFTRLSDSKEVWFPVNIIGNLYVSNGMAAGNTPSEARVQALSEIFERYVKNKIIAEGIALPQIPQSVIDRFPKIKEAIEALLQRGYHLRIADASLGGIYPVISVTLINPKEGSVFASFGAHPCFEVALERTVTELMQGRGLDQMDDFQPPSFNMDDVADTQNLETHFINATGLISYDFFKEQGDFEFVDWNHDADTQSEFEYLSSLVHDMGYEIYMADYDYLHVYTCRIIIPGMSEIYPVDDLLWSNNNAGAMFRESLLSLHDLDNEHYEELLEALEDAEVQDMQHVSEFIGIVPDAGSVFESLLVGELKAMLYLALQDYDNAIEWNHWCLQMNQLGSERMRLYRCLQALLEITVDEAKCYAMYQKSLELMFGKETVLTCLELIEGKQRFHGLKSPGLSLEGFETHQKLLDAYAKLQQTKLKYWNKT